MSEIFQLAKEDIGQVFSIFQNNTEILFCFEYIVSLNLYIYRLMQRQRRPEILCGAMAYQLNQVILRQVNQTMADVNY